MMPRVGTLTLCTALLVAFLQSPYFHIHHDNTSNHVRKQHSEHGLGIHTHISHAPAAHETIPAIQSIPAQAQNDAVFLPWVSKAPHNRFLLTALRAETQTVVRPAYEIAYSLASLARHAHDPPLVSSSAPRSPPV